jgi:DNA-binding NtrC family response regulator
VLQKSIAYDRDSRVLPQSLASALHRFGPAIAHAKSESDLADLVQRHSPECLIVLCTRELDTEAVRLVEMVRGIDEHCSLLVLTAALSPDAARRAMRSGASDLLEGCTSSENILDSLKVLEARHLNCAVAKTVDGELLGCQKMIGSGPAMTRVRCQLARVAASEANVLITGESGTGKELAAELIHQNSRRQARPFVAVNCAAVPDTLLESELFGYERGAFTGANSSHEGKLQHAAQGTLFLDEVGDMSLLGQAKILRAVDSRVIQRLGSNVNTTVQMRLIAATNQNLERMVIDKTFRPDLFYRLNVVRLALPPLRERRDDVPELMEYLVRDLSARQNERPRRFQSNAISCLQGYDWPGNIRELRNVLESILVFSTSKTIGLSDLPLEVRHGARSSEPPSEAQREKILDALNATSWNRKKAAESLNCSRMTLYRKMTQYAIQA